MSFSKTETDGFDKRDGKVTNFREESVTNMYASAEEGSLIAELSLTETRTGEAGEIDKLVRGKSWYADGCIYVQEEAEMSNSEKYRQEADFDFFLRYGKMSWQFADMTMIMQLLKGGFYDQVILQHCSEGVYKKFRIEIPAQTKDGVTNEMAFRFVFGEGNKLLGVKIETTMEFAYGDSIADGASGAYKTVARGSVLPYGGTVIKPEDLESFPEKQTGTETI